MSEKRGIWVGPDNTLSFRSFQKEYKPVGGQALIKVEFSGVNPADLKHGMHFGLNDNICGYEVCGTVIERGPTSVFQVGDVIFGMNSTNKIKPHSNGGHQNFAIAEEGHMWLPVPDGLPHADAAVLPTMVRTAADGLFNVFQIPFMSSDGPATVDGIGAIVVWGGASAVGVAAIQLAKAAGVSPIFTTASAKNHKALIKLGATKCFDYRNPTVVEEIQSALDESKIPLKYVLDTVVTRGPDSTTSKIEALKSTQEVKYAGVLPVFGNPNWTMVVAARGFDFPSPGGFAKAQPESDVVLQDATKWAALNYNKGFVIPNIRVITDGDAAVEAIQLSADGKISFEKLALQHPLQGKPISV
ncbi:hypothetical protein B0A52_02598 [Exophiala mesophila]|uniref:Enoyl reductase (ER) domain-containing protein n=1 Tax=Exophiala mesophila TaxID=212818 RepID=A0A438NDE7_EXOME|nr:hypothetical protein B0A52_02598 [Exophiala mesophila]